MHKKLLIAELGSLCHLVTFKVSGHFVFPQKKVFFARFKSVLENPFCICMCISKSPFCRCGLETRSVTLQWDTPSFLLCIDSLEKLRFLRL